MRPLIFWDTKTKQEIAVNLLPGMIFHLGNHKLNRIIDLYKALYKRSMMPIYKYIYIYIYHIYHIDIIYIIYIYISYICIYIYIYIYIYIKNKIILCRIRYDGEKRVKQNDVL